MRSAQSGDELQMSPTINRNVPVLAALALSSLHMLALGSFHEHGESGTDHLTSPHACFLCHVSSGVDSDASSCEAREPVTGLRVPVEPRQLEPRAPLVSASSARSPPSL